MAFAVDGGDRGREKQGGVPLFSGRGLLVALLIAALLTGATLFLPLPSRGPLADWVELLGPWIAPGAAVIGFAVGLVGHKLLSRAPAIEEPEAFVTEEFASDSVWTPPAAPSPAEEAPAAGPALADLGLVQLVERLAQALQGQALLGRSARDLAIPATLRHDLVALMPAEQHG